MPYLHGAYGEIGDSKVTEVRQGSVICAYIGTAPVNLVRGYAEAGIINMPVKLTGMGDVQNKAGYSKTGWEDFTLCEVFAEHFDNTEGDIGPIYIVNVLNPDIHRDTEPITEELTVKNNRVEIKSAEIILDTLAINDMAEGVDYTLSYNFSKGAAVVQFTKTPTTETVTCSYNTVDASMVDAADILGKETEEGEYTGLHAMSLLYQYCNAVLDILAAPGWSHNPEIYRAMVNTVTKLNGHWDGFVNADIPLEDEAGKPIDTMEKAKKWAEDHAYNSERSKVYWPKVKDGTGRVFHLSTVGSATMLRVDLSHNGVPFESPSNKAIMATGQYFGESSNNRGFDQQKANTLNESGITTACFWGGQWVLWGPHTAAYKYEDSITGNMDARAIFDVNLRMLMYITNQFQIDHGTEIDAPLTPTDKDTILNDEKRRLDNLCGIGALIGSPSVAFLESANSVNQMMNGDFVWDFTVTNTPPLKSATARVCYTDEGFNAFFESESE